ncbi:MAG: helix-turn-helix transcriptional regulator [Akkermansia sp.]|nr:helix-turn-helix transcriptional regulator [Akkermansia sp.]
MMIEIRLRELRESKGLKVSQMVQRLGVQDSRYRKWESNSAAIPLEYACRCADILHCTLDELAGRRAPEQPSISTGEQRVLDVYRSASEHGRVLIDAVIDGEARHMDESALKETRDA